MSDISSILVDRSCVAAIGSQLQKCIVRTSELIIAIQEGPPDLQAISKRVRYIEKILTGIEACYMQVGIPPTPNGTESLDRCRSGVRSLEAVLHEVDKNLELRRRFGRLQVVLRRGSMESLERGLQDAEVLLAGCQHVYWIAMRTRWVDEGLPKEPMRVEEVIKPRNKPRAVVSAVEYDKGLPRGFKRIEEIHEPLNKTHFDQVHDSRNKTRALVSAVECGEESSKRPDTKVSVVVSDKGEILLELDANEAQKADLEEVIRNKNPSSLAPGDRVWVVVVDKSKPNWETNLTQYRVVPTSSPSSKSHPSPPSHHSRSWVVPFRSAVTSRVCGKVLRSWE